VSDATGNLSNEMLEQLGVADVNFHVTKSIDQCPPGCQARELLANAIEAEMLDEEHGTRRIVLSAVEVSDSPKLAIINTGRGMTSNELVRATDLASSIRKKQGLDRDQNRGEGAKVAALPWNHAGLRLRSCRQGVVSEVILARVNDIYGRRRYAVVDEHDIVVSYDSAWDITETAKSEGYPIDHDWTEVVCFGRDEKQDTTRWPYGEGRGEGVRREVLTEVFDRFYSVPEWVKLEADESLHGRRGSVVFRLMKDVIAKWGNDNSKLRFERVPIRDGIEIEFVHTPMLSGNNTVMGAHELTGQSTRISLVWNGEMYDPHIGLDWRRIAAGFGLPHVHSEVSVFVHLPNDAPVRCGPYRVALMSKETGEALEVQDFQTEIRMAMPNWIRRLVSDALQPRQVSDMSAVRRELERRLREARIRPADLNRPGALPPSKPVLGTGPRSVTTLQPETGGGPGPRSKSENPTVLDPDAPTGRSGGDQGTGQRDGFVKRRRSIQTVTSAPEIIWLDSQSKIDGEELTDRAGKYDTATNTLYLNGLYDALQAKISNLENQYSQQVDWDQVRKLVVDKVRAAMALHIGSIVVYALAKQGRPAWTEANWKNAFTPESLTVAADQSEHLLGEIRSALVSTGAFKAARVV
jgi:hypothetical protein